jgi:DNA-directed RNA polymerase specialized sigma24 family protein
LTAEQLDYAEAQRQDGIAYADIAAILDKKPETIAKALKRRRLSVIPAL